jgi:hypothetical protein
MKPYKAFLYGALVTALAFTLVWAIPAAAATGCFLDTNGHWAEQFICWLKNNGIATGYPDGSFHPDSSVTRGEMAVMLQKANNIPPSTGIITINSGPTDWVYQYWTLEPWLHLQVLTDYLYVTSDEPGTYYFMMHPTFPSALYHRGLRVRGMQYCTVVGGDTFIDYMLVRAFYPIPEESGQDIAFTLVEDETHRIEKDDEQCPTYYFTPRLLDAKMILSVTIRLNWIAPDVSTGIRLGGVTFILEATEEGWD